MANLPSSPGGLSAVRAPEVGGQKKTLRTMKLPWSPKHSKESYQPTSGLGNDPTIALASVLTFGNRGMFVDLRKFVTPRASCYYKTAGDGCQSQKEARRCRDCVCTQRYGCARHSFSGGGADTEFQAIGREERAKGKKRQSPGTSGALL